MGGCIRGAGLKHSYLTEGGSVVRVEVEALAEEPSYTRVTRWWC